MSELQTWKCSAKTLWRPRKPLEIRAPAFQTVEDGFERGQHAPDAAIEMLHQGDVPRAPFVQLRRALLHFRQPLGGRFDGEMWRIVGEVEEEGPILRLRSLAQILDRPIRKQIRRVAPGLNDLGVAAHVIVSMTQMRRVAVHHVAEKAVEQIKAAFVRQVRRFEAEVPLADEAGVITRLLQLIRKRRHFRIEVTP